LKPRVEPVCAESCVLRLRLLTAADRRFVFDIGGRDVTRSQP